MSAPEADPAAAGRCAVPECDGRREHYNRGTGELTCACGTQGGQCQEDGVCGLVDTCGYYDRCRAAWAMIVGAGR